MSNLENCLFGAVKLTKNPDIDKYKYSGYGIGFDRRGTFWLGNGLGQNVLILGVDMSSSVHANDKTKNILVLGEGFTQGLDNKTIYAEKLYSINFTENNKRFCLSLHFDGSNSYLFVDSYEIHKSETKDSEIVANTLRLRNISRDFSICNIKKTGLNGYVYYFSVDYNAIKTDNIPDIHKYLMEKKDIK